MSVDLHQHQRLRYSNHPLFLKSCTFLALFLINPDPLLSNIPLSAGFSHFTLLIYSLFSTTPFAVLFCLYPLLPEISSFVAQSLLQPCQVEATFMHVFSTLIY